MGGCCQGGNERQARDIPEAKQLFGSAHKHAVSHYFPNSFPTPYIRMLRNTYGHRKAEYSPNDRFRPRELPLLWCTYYLNIEVYNDWKMLWHSFLGWLSSKPVTWVNYTTILLALVKVQRALSPYTTTSSRPDLSPKSDKVRKGDFNVKRYRIVSEHNSISWPWGSFVNRLFKYLRNSKTI